MELLVPGVTVRIDGESVTIAATDKFCPRQIGLTALSLIVAKGGKK